MRPILSRLSTFRLRLRRAVLRRRRLLAAVLVAVAVLCGLRATAAPAPPSDLVLTAAADLEAGTVLRPEDLTTTAFADGTAPDGASDVAAAVGRTLAAPLRRGEPVTDVRLVGPGLLATQRGASGLVALPVRIPDADAVALLRVGDRINLLSTDPRGGGTDTVAVSLTVLALPTADASGSFGAASAGGSTGGRLVVVGATPEMSELVADAAVKGYLSVTLTR
ncbi:SAF domain-containing protein [Nocardioides sp.]|uniref:SAF domain-containing protein n=1 Tax=Nocardioides sp. TaxID=35761 RepID=UPI003D143769